MFEQALALPHISGKQIEDFTYPSPSEQEQLAIGRQLDELREQSESLGGEQGHRLAALAALKRSLLHRALQGELSGHFVAS